MTVNDISYLLYTHLYIIFLSGLFPEKEGRNAREEEPEDAVESPTLPHVLGSAVGKAGATT